MEFAPRSPRIDSATCECQNFNRYTCAPHIQTVINLRLILLYAYIQYTYLPNLTNSITIALEIIERTGSHLYITNTYYNLIRVRTLSTSTESLQFKNHNVHLSCLCFNNVMNDKHSYNII